MGLNQGSVTRSFASGAVSVEGRASKAGGLVGGNGQVFGFSSTGVITLCYATGDVSAEGTYVDAGGLIGATSAGGRGGIIADNFAAGDVTVGGSSACGGGFIGYNQGEVQNCYSTGAVSMSADNSYTGGFAGHNYTSFSNCYFLSGDQVNYDVSGIGRDDNDAEAQSENVQGKTSGELKRESTFENWDFASVWRIEEDLSYPALRLEETSATSHYQAMPSHKRCIISRVRKNLLSYRIPREISSMDLYLYNGSGRRVSKHKNLRGRGTVQIKKLSAGLYIAVLKNAYSTGGSVLLHIY